MSWMTGAAASCIPCQTACQTVGQCQNACRTRSVGSNSIACCIAMALLRTTVVCQTDCQTASQTAFKIRMPGTAKLRQHSIALLPKELAKHPAQAMPSSSIDALVLILDRSANLMCRAPHPPSSSLHLARLHVNRKTMLDPTDAHCHNETIG